MIRDRWEKIGKNIVLYVAPGWFCAGAVRGKTRLEITLSPAFWLEGFSCPWPEAVKSAEKIMKSSPVEILKISRAAIFMESPVSENLISELQKRGGKND